ncbi:MAG: hypothetical protein GKS05_08620 [Nitrospirales bacterium]|nr:hypothetical protein [Nitrospirales bacterium]
MAPSSKTKGVRKTSATSHGKMPRSAKTGSKATVKTKTSKPATSPKPSSRSTSKSKGRGAQNTKTQSSSKPVVSTKAPSKKRVGNTETKDVSCVKAIRAKASRHQAANVDISNAKKETKVITPTHAKTTVSVKRQGQVEKETTTSTQPMGQPKKQTASKAQATQRATNVVQKKRLAGAESMDSVAPLVSTSSARSMSVPTSGNKGRTYEEDAESAEDMIDEEEALDFSEDLADELDEFEDDDDLTEDLSEELGTEKYFRDSDGGLDNDDFSGGW